MKTIQKHLANVEIYKLSYLSIDNLKISGFLMMPVDNKKKYPIIIANRGGNGNFGMVNEIMITKILAKLASYGYIVIGSNLRGNDESEGIDEFGGKDIDDVYALFNIFDEIENADLKRIYQMGWSRGGITNFNLLKRTDRIKKSINIAIPADLLKTERGEMFRVYKNRIPHYLKDSVYYSNKISPIYQFDSIKNKKVELYYIHGSADKQVACSNSVELYNESLKKGFYSDFQIIEGDSHNLFNEKLFWEKILFWLNN